jgi:outer membrane protein assembly factor BamB
LAQLDPADILSVRGHISMKGHHSGRRLSLLGVLALAALLVSACSGVSGNTSWPGLAASDTTAYLSFAQNVFAVDLKSGKELWRFPPKAQTGVNFYADPVPTADGQILVGGYNKILYELDASSGKPIWQSSVASDLYVSPVLDTAEGIFAPTADGNVFDLNPQDGTVLWKFSAQHGVWAQPVSDGSAIFVTSLDHHVYALSAATGKLIWSEDLGTALAGGATLSGNTLMVGTFDDRLVALDKGTGQVLWTAKAGGWVWGAPAVDSGTAFFGDLGGALHAVAVSDGHELWKIQPDGAIHGTPAVGQGMLYFGTEAGTVYAVSEKDGSILWQQTAGGNLYGHTLLVGDMVLVTSYGGQTPLYAFSAQNGSQLWSFLPAK